MAKLLSVVGARPQFIKEAMLQRALAEAAGMKEVLVHTGQHYDKLMSEDIFASLNMTPPTHQLNISGGLHGAMTGRMLIALESLMLEEAPDLVLLYGDTNSTLAGALAASKLNIPIAHVEAGMRQEPKSMPEEKNRVVTDHLSSYLYCATQEAVNNLKAESIEHGVLCTGDVMYDLFLATKDQFKEDVLKQKGLLGQPFALLTLHRDFNVDEKDRLSAILKALCKISKEIPILFPIHPRTAARIKGFGLETDLPNRLILIPPLPYLELMAVMSAASFVITDSGGLQKESYFAGKQALVIMPDSSWRELLDAKVNTLVSSKTLYDAYLKLDPSFVPPQGLYGDGQAAKTIVNDLLVHLSV